MDKVPESEPTRLPADYVRQYWEWVDSEFDRWGDDWEFGAVEPGPMTEG